jgi:hypothetical protein
MVNILLRIKPLFLNIAWLTILPLSTVQCDKKKEPVNCLEGKIIRITCATTVIQVLNVDTLGEDNWKDGSTEGNTFNNVFSVANKCDIPATIKTGDVLTFQLGEPVKQDCIVCMMYDNPPKISLGIVNINDCAVSKK